MVAKISTSEEDDKLKVKGRSGGEARKRKLTASKRSAIAQKAADAKWATEEPQSEEETS